MWNPSSKGRIREKDENLNFASVIIWVPLLGIKDQDSSNNAFFGFQTVKTKPVLYITYSGDS